MTAIIHQRDKRSGIHLRIRVRIPLGQGEEAVTGEEDPDRQSGLEDGRDRPDRRQMPKEEGGSDSGQTRTCSLRSHGPALLRRHLSVRRDRQGAGDSRGPQEVLPQDMETDTVGRLLCKSSSGYRAGEGFDRRLAELKGELESGRRGSEHETWYRRYFDVSSTPKRGVKVTVKEDAVALKKRYLGFFVLLSNEKMDATMALDCQVHFSV